MKKKSIVFALPVILTMLLSGCSSNGGAGQTGPKGDQGETGPIGPQGPAGQDGSDGLNGADGTSVLTGNGEPSSSLGKIGDSYIDLTTWNYYVKEETGWILKGNIKGEQGEPGQDGEDGQNGSNGQTGPQGPAGSDGEDGVSIVSITKTNSEGLIDTYTITYSDGHTSTFTVANGANGQDGAQGSQGIQGEPGADGHTPIISISEDGYWVIDGIKTTTLAEGKQGETGPTGPQGPAGQDGINGQDGTSVLTGDGEPSSSLGKIGDSYINLSNWNYYVKEESGWVLKGNIKGEDGVSPTIDYYTVTFDSNGGSPVDSQEVACGNKATRPEDPVREGYTFVNWYFEENSTLYPWLFRAYSVTEDLTLYAQWKADYYNSPTKNGYTVTYGLYPQTVVSSATTITALNSLSESESNGWYLYNDCYYAKAVATNPWNGGADLSNGETIVVNKTYWFKCEPITWDIAKTEGDNYYLTSSMVLDCKKYYSNLNNRTILGETIYPSNYEYSEIREWLNNDFYGAAFGSRNDYIKTSTLDNSGDGRCDPQYACSDTDDLVYLGTIDFYQDSCSYFCPPTDYAKVRGVFNLADSAGGPFAGFWTRTPSSDTSPYVFEDSCGAVEYANNEAEGIRPCIVINL
jgi:uncharacterized repeat protein (TIGR02543 family)